MSLMSVEAARASILQGVLSLGVEAVGLAEADGRWLAEAVVAGRDQPPFDGSAMDGWAVRTADLGGGPLTIVGESAAGRGRETPLAVGEAVRIFTGAPMPPGADRVVIQEEARVEDERLIVLAATDGPAWVRARGGDYREGQTLIASGTRLDPWRIALAASAGHATLTCARRPRIAVLSGGDEVVEPGGEPGPQQIHDAAGPGVAALAGRAGAQAWRLPLVGDTVEAVAAALAAAHADVIVTIGGASVGDHDRMKPAARSLGAVLSVEGVAMRPGKPLWAARLPDGRRILGLPGNPVSALVCAELFLLPLVAALQGGRTLPVFDLMPLAEALPANGPREHYMRAAIRRDAAGWAAVRPLADQDSSLVALLAGAEALIQRPRHAPAVVAGEAVPVLSRAG